MLSPQPRRMLDEPVDIFVYVRHVAERWRLVALGVGAGVIVAGVFTVVAQPLYRSTLKLLVVPARLDQAGTATARLDPLLAYNFLPFVRNADAVARAIDGLGLNRPEQRWKLTNFGQRLSTVVSKDAPIIELTLDFPDAEAGTQLITRIADEAIKLNRDVLTRSDQEARQFLKQQLDASQEQLRGREEAMQQFLRASNVDQLKNEAKAHMKHAARLVRELQRTRLQNIELAASTQTIDKLLSEEQKLVALRRGAGDGAGGGASAVSEAINPVYEQMGPKLLEQRSQLAATTRAVDRLAADLRESRDKARTALLQLNKDQLIHDKLKLELDVARDSFKNLSERYEQARISVAANSADLRIFEQPRQGGKVSPRPVPNILVGAVLGGMLAVLVALGAALFQLGAATSEQLPAQASDRVATL